MSQEGYPLPIGIFCERHPVQEATEVCRRCGGGACSECWTFSGRNVLCLNCASARFRNLRWLKRGIAVGAALAVIIATLASIDVIRYGSHGKAIRDVRNHLVHKPRDVKGRLELGRLLLAARHRDEALTEYRAILSFDPYSERAHGNVGILLYENGDIDGAAFHLATSIDIDPTYYDAHRYIALIYERRLELADAERSWRRALELSPNREARIEAGHALARNLERLGRKFEAAEVLYGLAPWVSEEDARAGISARISRLREEADAGEPLLLADAVEVRFRPRGPVIPVRGLINERIPVSFIVDTGASYTTIPAKIAEEMGVTDLDQRNKVNFRTADGDVTTAVLVQVESLQIKDARVENLTVAVCDSCGDGLIDGLLGLNFLQKFQVEIDSSSGRLILRAPEKHEARP